MRGKNHTQCGAEGQQHQQSQQRAFAAEAPHEHRASGPNRPKHSDGNVVSTLAPVRDRFVARTASSSIGPTLVIGVRNEKAISARLRGKRDAASARIVRSGVGDRPRGATAFSRCSSSACRRTLGMIGRVGAVINEAVVGLPAIVFGSAGQRASGIRRYA